MKRRLDGQVRFNVEQLNSCAVRHEVPALGFSFMLHVYRYRQDRDSMWLYTWELTVRGSGAVGAQGTCYQLEDAKREGGECLVHMLALVPAIARKIS